MCRGSHLGMQTRGSETRQAKREQQNRAERARHGGILYGDNRFGKYLR